MLRVTGRGSRGRSAAGCPSWYSIDGSSRPASAAVAQCQAGVRGALRRLPLRRHDQHDGRSRQHGRARVRALRRRRRGRTELRGDEIDFVGRGIERQRPGAALSRDVLDHAKGVRRVLVHDGQRSIAVGRIGEAGRGIERRSVGTAPGKYPKSTSSLNRFFSATPSASKGHSSQGPARK